MFAYALTQPRRPSEQLLGLLLVRGCEQAGDRDSLGCSGSGGRCSARLVRAPPSSFGTCEPAAPICLAASITRDTLSLCWK
jgi:hypothetical protein